jgi:hypothetical protein
MTLKKKTGNIVKDDPKAAAKRSSGTGRFKDPKNQPSPEAISSGLKRRRLAIQMQEEIEQSIEEMLKDPATDTLKLKDYILQFPKEIPVGRIAAKLLQRDILNPKTSPMARAKLLDTYNKIAYGDKVDHTSSDGSMDFATAFTDFLDKAMPKKADHKPKKDSE